MYYNHDTDKAFDKIAKIVCEEKQKEIDVLKAYIKQIGYKGRELSMRHSTLSNINSEIDLFSDAHDLFDFLQAM